MRSLIFSGLAALCPTVAMADRCLEIRELMDSTGTGQLNATHVGVFAGEPNCSISQDERGAQSYLCYWTYPYRDDRATSAFEDLSAEIQMCLPDAAELPADKAVNHPDSYLLDRYVQDEVVISTSLKDKAALGQSLVFLRIDRK